MGVCLSAQEKEYRRKNADINSQIKKDKEIMKREVKMLLLGESGKSTILKQMKLIHEGGYNRREKEMFKDIIFSNTIQSMKVILEAMQILKIPLGDESNEPHAVLLSRQSIHSETDSIDPEVGIAIKALWEDSGVREAFRRSSEYQLNDSAKYYFESIDRIASAGYIPTDQDVLRSRVKTTGITETTFHMGNLTYRMFDVGGQRSERKKWIHCFENVTAILFLVAISEYDQVLIEDESVNRMQEALTLFESICNSRWFMNTSIILFLNKIDIFKEKIYQVPISKYFPDYSGADDDYEAACDYFKKRFVALNRSESKQVYPHFTCATDTTQIKFVMSAVNDIIIQNSLRDAGLL